MPSLARTRLAGALVAAVVAVAACGAPEPPQTPQQQQAQPEVRQSRLIEKTFAGMPRCDAKSHDRPFVVEWDATDISSFQARSNTDVLFVKYEGCNLTVIDSCSDDSVHGALGSYKPVDWTSGAVEMVDIENSADLVAKLPLGIALLGGRVESGEKFHMEYFVSGTRSATRPVVYRGELAKIPGCTGVTHFVYGYNLGAFALGSKSKLQGSASATVWGFGASGSAKNATAVEKRAGDIASCRAESARELDGCKVPVRLTLREITDGENPDKKAAQAPETDDAKNLAGKLVARTDKERRAGDHYTAAVEKFRAGDGKGCLASLDMHDRLDPRPAGLSTNPKSGASFRGMCVMLAGQCDAGKSLVRRAYQAQGNLSPEQVDRMVDSAASSSCRGGKRTDRDKLIHALHVLQTSGERVSAAECASAYATGTKLAETIKSSDSMDPTYDAGQRISRTAPACFARAGDCAGAWKTTKDLSERGLLWAKTPIDRAKSFVSDAGKLCIDKDVGAMSDAETISRAHEELERHAKNQSAGFCTSRLDKATAALQRSLPNDAKGELKYEARGLAAAAAECLAANADCEQAWKRYAATRRAFLESTDRSDRADMSIRNDFRDKVRSCRFKPQGEASMSAKDRTYWAAGVLDDASRGDSEPKVCLAAFEVAKKSAGADSGGDAFSTMHSELENSTRDIPRNLGRCLQRAGDCKGAYAAYRDAYARFKPARRGRDADEGEAGVRKHFESDVSECKGR